MYLRHLGYACQNMTLGTVSRTVRRANLRTEKVIPVVTQNLEAIRQMLLWNIEHHIHFLRISSDLIPFATLPAFPFDWADYVLMEDVQFVLDTMARVGSNQPFDLMLEAKRKECAVREVQHYLETGTVPDRPVPMEELVTA